MAYPEFEVKPITPTGMRILSCCTIKNASLGESIDAVAHCPTGVRFQKAGLRKDAGENETRKNPEQAFKRFFLKAHTPRSGQPTRSFKADETYCQSTPGGCHSAPSHLLSFSTSHASTSTHVENGPAFCFYAHTQTLTIFH